MLSSLLPHIPAHIPAWWYYLCVGLAVVITGLAKSGFGGGVGILAIPLMALAMGPQHMLGVMLPLLVACDILSNLHHLGHYDGWRRLRVLLAGLIAGILVGTGVLWYLRSVPAAQFNHVMTGVVGFICLAVVVMQAYRLTGREVPTLPPHPLSAAAVGTVAGVVSTINHAAGPIVQVYLMQREEDKLNKRRLVGTLLLYFLIGNSLKLPTYCLLPMADGRPLINTDTLRDSIWFIPLIPLGTLLGAWLHHRVAEKPFSAIMYVGAGASAAYMVYKVSWQAAVVCTALGAGVVVWAVVRYLKERRSRAGSEPEHANDDIRMASEIPDSKIQ